MVSIPPSIAVTSTLAMVRTAEARGIETEGLLREAGLTREVVEDPDARVPAPAVLAVWNQLRERTGDPTLQLAAPTILPWGAYRVIDYLVAASATVGDGVRRFAAFFGLIADAMTLTIASSREEHCLDLAMAHGGPVPPVYVDYVFAALVGRVRMKPRRDLCVCRVDLRHPEPPLAGRYAELFRAPVVFGAVRDRLCFSEEEWRAPMDHADVALARILEEHARVLAERIPHTAPGFVSEVQKAVTATLADGARVEDVADTLHVSVRTLQRKLVAEGTTFRELTDVVRGELALGAAVKPLPEGVPRRREGGDRRSGIPSGIQRSDQLQPRFPAVDREGSGTVEKAGPPVSSPRSQTRRAMWTSTSSACILRQAVHFRRGGR